MLPLCPPGERPGGHGSPLPPFGGEGGRRDGVGAARPRGAVIAPPPPLGNCRSNCRKAVPSDSCIQSNCRSICRKRISSDSCSQGRCRRKCRRGPASDSCPVLSGADLLRPQGAPNRQRDVRESAFPVKGMRQRKGDETAQGQKWDTWASPPCSGPPAEAGGTIGTGAAGPSRAG